MSIITGFLGRLLGLESAQRIEGYELSLGAPWAHDAPAWIFFGCAGLSLLAVLFYVRYQRQRNRGARIVLAVLRAVALCTLFVLLTEPILRVDVSSRKRPSLWLLVDGTDSMAIADEFTPADRAKLNEAVGLEKPAEQPESAPAPRPTRIDYVKALLQKTDGNLLGKLADKFRVKAFLFDRPDGVRSLDLSSGGRRQIDGEHLAEQLTANGTVTALGAALGDLARREATSNLAGLVLISDFDQNAGRPAVAAAKELGVPIYAVGVGSRSAVDVAVAVQADPYIRKDESGKVTVTVRQQGLENQTINVTLLALRLGGEEGASGDTTKIGEKPVTLAGASQDVEFTYVPDKSGRFSLIAEVEPVPGEVVVDNNRALREITVLEDFLRLLFVEYEPTWEWRFIKEVFHRDKLVGTQGFRTFLRSSDPRVRQSKEMFLPTMAPSRAEFFANDVIFLGDLPASALSPRFCEMAEEFVGKFGGGLVILAGPRFGPGQIAETSLGKLLPVTVDPGAKIYDRQPFRLQLTPLADSYPFMRLAGDKPGENQKIWDNLGMLPWYQPVERKHSQTTVLAEHPSHTCVDGKTHQPLIAIRPYGNGEVVYLGCNETWRLRRMYGEQYYRAFWGALIHRLALSHALGAQKRFVVQTDRRRYQTDDFVTLTVEAYDSEYHALAEKDLPEHKLQAELILPARATTTLDNLQSLSLPQTKEGKFETRFPVFAGGEYRVRVSDPITGKAMETTFQVTSVAVERQSAVCNVDLQEALAAANPGGATYDLTNVAGLADEITLPTKIESSVEIITLWNTWFSFGLVVVLLFGEWALRKWVNLP